MLAKRGAQRAGSLAASRSWRPHSLVLPHTACSTPLHRPPAVRGLPQWASRSKMPPLVQCSYSLCPQVLCEAAPAPVCARRPGSGWPHSLSTPSAQPALGEAGQIGRVGSSAAIPGATKSWNCVRTGCECEGHWQCCTMLLGTHRARASTLVARCTTIAHVR